MLDLTEINGIMMVQWSPNENEPLATFPGDGMANSLISQGRRVIDHVLDWMEEREMDLYGAHEEDDPLCNL